MSATTLSTENITNCVANLAQAGAGNAEHILNCIKGINSSHEYFGLILLLLAASVIFISITRRLNLPPIIGYIIVGVLVGPGGFGFISDIEQMEFLAEFGVVFLMFTLGLEFSIPKLLAMKRLLLGMGGSQVFITGAIAFAGAMLFGVKSQVAFVVAGALALSSTAVVIKQLTEQNEQQTPHGSMAITILLFQDLTAVLLLIVIPALSGDSADPFYYALIKALLKGTAVFIGSVVVGLWFLRPLFREVGSSRSTELFMITTVLVALSAAWITHELNLSMALGAFLAGMMLGETEFRHQIEIDIRPFRDMLLGLFFILIGAFLEVKKLPDIWAQVLLLLAAIIVVKTLIIMLIAKVIGKAKCKQGLKTGLILAQGGEFGFVVLTEAANRNIFPTGQMEVVFAAIAISILLAPLFIRFNHKLINLFFNDKPEADNSLYTGINKISEHSAELSNHVIICGYGRVGQILARYLTQEHINYISLDLDPRKISACNLAGDQTFYGDARNPATLAAAKLSKARMVVITISNENIALEILTHVRSLHNDIPVFVRTRNDSNLKSFQEAGATEVVPESLEGCLMLASHLLLTLGVPSSRVLAKVRSAHADRYKIMTGYFKGSEDQSGLEQDLPQRMGLHSITICEGSFAIDKTIREVFAGREEGFEIKALSRKGIRYSNPHLDVYIRLNDVIVVHATPEEAYIAEELVLRGKTS